MQEQAKPKMTIIRNNDSITITVHGNYSGQRLDQHISFNCYGSLHRNVFNKFADTIMQQRELSPEKVYRIAQSYDKKYVSAVGMSRSYKNKRSVCKVIF